MRGGFKIFDADTHLNPMALARKPGEYITSGRFFASVVIHEGEKMVGRVTEFHRRRRIDVFVKLSARRCSHGSPRKTRPCGR